MSVLRDRSAIVTGAGRGIGRGVARALAQEGAAVVIAEIDPATGQATAQELSEMGLKAVFTECDVTDEASVQACVRQTVAAFGRLDILVNNAQAVRAAMPFEDHTDADFGRTLDSGLWGTFRFMRAAFSHMKVRGGKIVNVASPAGLAGYPGWAAYVAAKEGVRGMTKVAANEWGRFGINVNVICPSAATPSFAAWKESHAEDYELILSRRAIKRDGDPEADIGRAVVFLAGPDSDFITGHTLVVSGGGLIGL